MVDVGGGVVTGLWVKVPEVIVRGALFTLEKTPVVEVKLKVKLPAGSTENGTADPVQLLPPELRRDTFKVPVMVLPFIVPLKVPL